MGPSSRVNLLPTISIASMLRLAAARIAGLARAAILARQTGIARLGHHQFRGQADGMGQIKTVGRGGHDRLMQLLQLLGCRRRLNADHVVDRVVAWLDLRIDSEKATQIDIASALDLQRLQFDAPQRMAT